MADTGNYPARLIKRMNGDNGEMATAVQAVYRHFGTRRIVISAQAHLTAFYEKCGFTVCSDVYDEDGIPHCDMFRPAAD